MFRIHHFVREALQPGPVPPRRDLPGPVVIWNLIRRCNLACRHCYTNSYDKDFPGELTTTQVFQGLADLKAAGVRVLMLSGGEPLLRPDLFEIAARAKELGFYTGLSSNGTRIGAHNIEAIAAVGFDYLGVSLDGLGATNDEFRRTAGAFEAALAGLRLARDHGIKVGVRTCLTQQTAHDLPAMLRFLETEGIDKFYLSHLNYTGRGYINRGVDAHGEMTRAALELLFEEARRCLEQGVEREFVTGNNDADGVYLLRWVERHLPERAAHVRACLAAWGGNATGVNIANIDATGDVHPDSFFQSYTLGNILRRPFKDIWSDVSDPFLRGLKQRPRPVSGRCGACSHLDVCNGNTRVRAFMLSKDFWAEDPGCYLSDEELGVSPTNDNARQG
ncbi:MAG: heme d1 biosynthesis radical SAM protein NirJ [Deltaproteobacteria bacterium]|nr:heme d1 biosynthesis radical SAM protein NirJ [Deltaproteobacteria bacterium]